VARRSFGRRAHRYESAAIRLTERRKDIDNAFEWQTLSDERSKEKEELTNLRVFEHPTQNVVSISLFS
jgi:hypothetical protein